MKAKELHIKQEMCARQECSLHWIELRKSKCAPAFAGNGREQGNWIKTCTLRSQHTHKKISYALKQEKKKKHKLSSEKHTTD